MKGFDVLKYKMWKSNSKKASKFSFFEFISLNWSYFDWLFCFWEVSKWSHRYKNGVKWKFVMFFTIFEQNDNLESIKSGSRSFKLKIFSNTIKSCSKSYYPPRSKKTLNLIKRISEGKQKKMTLGGCILSRKGRFIEVIKEA